MCIFDCFLWFSVWIPPSHHHLTNLQFPCYLEDSVLIQLSFAPSAGTIDGRAVKTPWSLWLLTQLGCDVLEPITTSLSERLRRTSTPQRCQPYLNSLDNCCCHSQRWVTFQTYALTYRLARRLPRSATAPREVSQHCVFLSIKCIMLSDGY